MGLAVLLLFLPLLSVWFLSVYLMAGITDALDGFLARRWNVVTQFGAKLDSAADFLLFGVLLFRVIATLQIPTWITLLIAGIALLRLSALATCYAKFRQFAFLHTYANKVTGILLFCFPFLLRFVGLVPTAALLCAVSSVSALEELLIQLIHKPLDLNIKSILLP